MEFVRGNQILEQFSKTPKEHSKRCWSRRTGPLMLYPSWDIRWEEQSPFNSRPDIPCAEFVIVSTFTTMDEMVRKQIGITLGPLLRHRFDNKTSLETILSQNRVPEIAILHGQSDEIVPLRMGAALAQLDPSRIKFAVIPEADHNDIIQKGLPLILQTMGLPG